jgi:alkylation response protein AidB-like acyl-CoA dehydrogenase
MDFEFTDEQKALRDTVRRFLAEKIEPMADEYDRKGPLCKEDALMFLKML